MQRLQSLSRRLVIVPNFYAEGALPRRRHHVERVDRRALAAETQSLEPRDREQRHVQTIARFDFTNTRRDVATQWHDLEIRAQVAVGDPDQFPGCAGGVVSSVEVINRLTNDTHYIVTNPVRLEIAPRQ